MSRFIYHFFTNDRKKEAFSEETLHALLKLEEKFGDDGCDPKTGYLSEDSTKMIYVTRSTDEVNWELCGKLEYFLAIDSENRVSPVAKINWICADKCGQVLYNRFKSLVAGFAKKIVLTCSLNEFENQAKVMSRLNFWMKNNFKARRAVYSSPSNYEPLDNEAIIVNLYLEYVMKD